MGRLVVDEAAVPGEKGAEDGGPPEGWGWGEEAGDEAVAVAVVDGEDEVVLRLEPNPRPLKREFIELIRSGERRMFGIEGAAVVQERFANLRRWCQRR